MSSNSNQGSTQLTFKDWKSLKESKNKSNEKPKDTNNVKSKRVGRNTANDSAENRNNNNGFMGSRGPNCQGTPNLFTGFNRVSNFMSNNSFNGMNGMNFNGNNFQNNYRPHENNSFGPLKNSFSSNNFNFPNNNINFNRQNNFGGNNNNGFNDSNTPNNFGNRFKGFNDGNNLNFPNEFFASDGIYRQKDLMQKPLPNNNPFRNDHKAEQLLKEFDLSRYAKEKKKGKKKTSETKVNKAQRDTPKLGTKPEVFVPNPKAKVDGKPYIPKPKVPEPNLEISKEEKKQQWKEYRQAMKPFKNREFYNAKRVVQRLGKKAPSELEEKEIIRLANAREVMVAHKANLADKYPNYIKADDSSNELGELFVLKKNPPKYPDYARSKQFKNVGNFGDSDPNNGFESGRKILGSNTGFKGFVSGGLLDTAARMATQ